MNFFFHRWTGTIATSGLNYKQNRQSKWLLWILKLKMYKLIKRVLFYNLPTHNQTTAEAVLLLPTYFLWQQPITPDNCCAAWTAPADRSEKNKTKKKKRKRNTDTHTHTHFKGFKYMQPLSSNWSRNRCRQNMLEDNSDRNFQHLCLCYVVSCYIDILCTSVCSTSPFFIDLHFFFLHPHRKTGHERDRATSFNTADGRDYRRTVSRRRFLELQERMPTSGHVYDFSVSVVSQMRGELSFNLWMN